jgi:hypothetical protein
MLFVISRKDTHSPKPASLPPYELPCVLSTCLRRRVIQLSAAGHPRCAHCHSRSQAKAIQYSSIQLQIQPKRGIWPTILPHANTNLLQNQKSTIRPRCPIRSSWPQAAAQSCQDQPLLRAVYAYPYPIPVYPDITKKRTDIRETRLCNCSK